MMRAALSTVADWLLFAAARIYAVSEPTVMVTTTPFVPCLCCPLPATGLALAGRWRLPTCDRHALRVVASAEVGEA
jgi:hypothetical protein